MTDEYGPTVEYSWEQERMPIEVEIQAMIELNGGIEGWDYNRFTEPSTSLDGLGMTKIEYYPSSSLVERDAFSNQGSPITLESSGLNTWSDSADEIITESNEEE